jgi:integration host factor subunit alpha
MISGFGKFRVKNKKKRRGRNPATGKDIVLAPRKVITFKWSEKLKEKLNTKPITKEKKRRVKSIKK